ncbi:MAG: hypothetical protein AB3X44_01290 [Leptothrix sp. (in: b-proteobacteria)]
MKKPAHWLAALLAACTFGVGCPAAATAASATSPATAQPDCLGERQPLTVAGQMPYALVSVGGREGYMVLDFGASVSSITPANFQGRTPPQPIDGVTTSASGRFDNFVFYGSWGTVQLLMQPQPAVQQLKTADGQAFIRQAGVIGTDLLAQHIYTLDYRAGHLWRAASGAFCSDAALTGAGYRAVSTQDYYGTNPAGLSCPLAGAPPQGCVNIPTIPIRIGGVPAVAQLDTGYDDSLQPYAININAALFDALKAAGVKLKAQPAKSVLLSTCQPGISEPVEAYSLTATTPAGIVDTAGQLLPRKGPQVTLFVKRTPAAATSCGGIGTWAQPAAQLGASFVVGGSLVVDPFSARVWLR